MSITSFLSEGEKTCSLRSRKEATATGRQCLRPTESAGYKRFLPCVCRNKAICASLLGVSKAARNRDSSIIQITAADVNPLSAKKTICPVIPPPKPKKLPCAVIAEEVCKKLLQTKSAVAAQGSSGVGEGIGERATPFRRGSPSPQGLSFRLPKSEGSNRHRQAVPAPNRICRVQTLSALRLSQQSDMRFIAWCFQGREESRLFYYTNNRRRCQPLIRKKDNLSGDPPSETEKTSLRGNRRRSL